MIIEKILFIIPHLVLENANEITPKDISLSFIKSLFTGLFTVLGAMIAVSGVRATIYSNQNLKNQELLNDLDQKSEWRKELMNIAAKPVIQLEDVYRILASLRFLPKRKDEIEGEDERQPNEERKKGEDERQPNEERKKGEDERQPNEERKKGEDERQSNEERQKDKGNQKGGSDQKEFDVISNYIYKRLNTMLNERLNNLSVNETLTDEILNRPFSIKKSEEIRLYTKFLLKHHWEYNKGEEDKEEFKKKELREFKNVIKEIYRLNEMDSIKEIYRLNKNNSEKKEFYKIDKIHTGDLEIYADSLNNSNRDK
ncbi:hypothetical protein [Staphylococcus hominis]|uniref:hypothetical protein n=1 Tax=Staphylococcus hominis TaxID=1290 RepID=UPI002878C9B9|nr:hypothetical protein [Staphylococcus hominis]MDS3871831.1 hypothetical protein [Staphylococcus hominis]